MRTIALGASLVALWASLCVASAQAPSDEERPAGRDVRAAGDPYEAPAGEAGIPSDPRGAPPYSDGADDEGAYDDGAYDEGAPEPGPDDAEQPPSPYDEGGAYRERDDETPYTDQEPYRDVAPEPQPRRHAELRKRRHWPARGDTGFRPYSDTGLGGSGYAGGYYGAYPESY
jgi:hypothetical protein